MRGKGGKILTYVQPRPSLGISPGSSCHPYYPRQDRRILLGICSHPTTAIMRDHSRMKEEKEKQRETKTRKEKKTRKKRGEKANLK